MSMWEEVDRLIDQVVEPGYRGDRDTVRREARQKIQRAFLDLERKAAERDTLRGLLVDEGIQNAQLTVENEQLRVQLQGAGDGGG